MKMSDGFPTKPTEFSGSFPFLSLPGEIRNRIYTLCFAQNIYCSKVVFERQNRWLTEKRPTYFDILLVSRRIYKEARSIAEYEFMCQLRLRRQYYKIPDWERKSVLKCTLRPKDHRAPECRNVSALARLQFPGLGFRFYGSTDKCDEVLAEERVHILHTFFSEMVEAFQKHGIPSSIIIHLPKSGEPHCMV